MKKDLIIKVSIGVAAIAGLALTTTLLMNDKDNTEDNQETATVEQNVEQTDVEENTEDVGEVSDSENEENQASSSHDDHDHDEHSDHVVNSDHVHINATEDEYKSEDIISSYFAAITLNNPNTLNSLFPSGKTENEQLALLLQNSTIVADIVDMEKVSISDNKAEYTVVVQLYTKEADNNFTNNQTTYKLVMDLSKGVITSKTTVSTEYLE